MRESAGRPPRRFASRGPEREIGHARQCLEVNITHRPQAVHDRIEEDTQNTRLRDFELAPKLAPRTSLRLANGRQGQKNRPVGQIRPADHLLDAVQQDGARRFKQDLLIVSVELPGGEAAAGREPAKGVREPVGQAREVVERKEIAVIAAIISSRSWRDNERTGAALGSISALSSLERTDFTEPCSPDIARRGYGPPARNAANGQATINTKSFRPARLRNELSASMGPTLFG
jgi:hypothetical protein